jgi:hypothetical protein
MAGLTMSIGALARIAKLVALLLFLLPWVTVSCSPRGLGPAAAAPAAATTDAGDMILVRATGLQLATGRATPAQSDRPRPGAPPNPFSSPDPPIAGGALLILLSLAASFVSGRRGSLAAAAGCALAAIALAYAVLARIPAEVHASFAGSPLPPTEFAQMIHVRTEIGFWLTLLALAAAMVLNVLAIRGRPPAAAASAE